MSVISELINALDECGISVIKDREFRSKSQVVVGNINTDELKIQHSLMYRYVWEKNKRLYRKLRGLLREFYTNRNTKSQNKIMVIEGAEKYYCPRLVNRGFKTSQPYRSNNKREEKIKVFRNEFKAFLKFILPKLSSKDRDVYKELKSKYPPKDHNIIAKVGIALIALLTPQIKAHRIIITQLSYSDDPSQYPLLELKSLAPVNDLESIINDLHHNNRRTLISLSKLLNDFYSQSHTTNVLSQLIITPFNKRYRILDTSHRQYYDLAGLGILGCMGDLSKLVLSSRYKAEIRKFTRYLCRIKN